MFAPPVTTAQASTEAPLKPAQAFSLILLGILLTFVCLSQLVSFIVSYELFIATVEVLFVGVFLLDAARTGEAPSLKPSAGAWLFLAWLVAASLSVMLSNHVQISLSKHAEWLTHILFGYALWRQMGRDPSLLKWILLLIPLGFFLTGLFLVAYWFSLNNPHAHNWFVGTPLFGHIRHFGYYALAGLVFSASPLLGRSRRRLWARRGVVLAALSICWGFLFWTGGRAAIGSGFVALALIVWFAEKRHRTWAAGIALAATGIGLWLSTLFWVEIPWVGVANLVERTSEATSLNGVTTGRLTIWAEALRPLEGLRWLIGLGPDAYRHIPTKTFGVQPHSLIVQFVLEWGLLGALLFLALLAVVFRKGLIHIMQESHPGHKTARVTALALIVGATVHSLVDGLYFHAQPLLFLFICFAVILLPVSPAPFSVVRPSLFRYLTARRTLWTATIVLGLFAALKSNTLYMLLFR